MSKAAAAKTSSALALSLVSAQRFSSIRKWTYSQVGVKRMVQIGDGAMALQFLKYEGKAMELANTQYIQVIDAKNPLFVQKCTWV